MSPFEIRTLISQLSDKYILKQSLPSSWRRAWGASEKNG
jgi:hypothetical protein